MKLSSRFALALLLGTALATTLSSCDNRWSPGKNLQFKRGFSNAPGWHAWDVNRDSINNQQTTPPATGEGAATATKKDTAKGKSNPAPVGASASPSQTASSPMSSTSPAQPPK